MLVDEDVTSPFQAASHPTGDEETGRRGDGGRERRGDGEIWRRGEGETWGWGERETGRWGGVANDDRVLRENLFDSKSG